MSSFISKSDISGVVAFGVEAPSVVAPVIEKKKINRCPECKHKLLLSDMACRCGQIFCMNHRFPESHHCTFDYKTLEKDILTKSLVKVVASKLATIT